MDPLPPLPERFAAPLLIGEGSSAFVWRVEDRRCGDYAALKVVRSNLARLPRFRGRFAREVALTASIVHPHVVPIRDHGVFADGRPYCLMAFADQRSLEEQANAGPELYLRWLDEVLSALAVLHSRGLVHQDIKPENILLRSRSDGELEAWLTDLGVAGARFELATTRKAIAGTPAWMAPEQRLGRPQELGPSTDLYAVGLILAAMAGFRFLPGKHEGSFPPEVGVLSGGEGAPVGLHSVLERLLHPDPRQRFDRAADLRRALAGVHEPHEAGWVRAARTVVGSWAQVPPGPMPPEAPADAGLGPVDDALRLLALRAPPLRLYADVAQRVWSAADAVRREGGPRVVVLVGHDDVGKSRLLQSLGARLDEGGWMEPLVSRFHDPPQADDGFIGLLQDLLAPWGDTRDGAQARVARWLARDQHAHAEDCKLEAQALVRWCGFLAPGEAPVNAGLGVAALLRHQEARAWRGGAALLLEDVHLCREPGDGFALLLAIQERTVGERRLLAVATIDREALAQAPALVARLSALQAAGAEVIELPRPSAADMEGLLLGFGFCAELARELAPRCGGSPVMAGLLLRDWAARGLLRRDEAGALDLRAGLALDLVASGTIDQLCERRVDGALGESPVPAEAAEALSIAALAGRCAPMAVVRRVCPEGIDGLLATGLVAQIGGRLLFEHGQIYEVALRRATVRADVRGLHRRLSEAWAQIGKESGVEVDLPVGRHGLWGGDAGAALNPLLHAGRQALMAGRSALAVEAAELAVEAAEATGSRIGQVDALQVLAEALLEQDQPELALHTLELVGAVDRRAQGRVALLRARARLAQGQLGVALKLLTEAGARFEAVTDKAGLAEVAHGQGTVLRLQGQPLEAAERFHRVLALNKGKDPRLEVTGLAGRIECHLIGGQPAMVEADLRRLWALAHLSGDTRSLARASYVTGLNGLVGGRWSAAERGFRTALGLGATLGDDRLQFAAENALGEVLRYQSILGAAARAYGRAARLARSRRWGLLEAVARINLCLLWWTPERGPALAELEAVSALLEASPQHWVWVLVHLLRGVIAAEADDQAEAEAQLAAALQAGLGGYQSPDLLPPLRALIDQATAKGWQSLATRVRAAGALLQPAPPR